MKTALDTLFLWIGTVVLCFCLFFAIGTVQFGFPSFGEYGYLIADRSEDNISAEDLLIFTPCGISGIDEGDYVVYRVPFGAEFARCISADGERAVVEGKDGGVTVIAKSLVLGKAVKRNAVAGRVILSVAKAKTTITVLSLVVGVWCAISLIMPENRDGNLLLFEFRRRCCNKRSSDRT
ncbi:MAG: hypothetical protein ACLUE6_05845 [Acutalibacteraceae bacterium]